MVAVRPQAGADAEDRRPTVTERAKALRRSECGDGRPPSIRRAYKFRMRPTARQHTLLAACLDSHRELYNAALQERREAWATNRVCIRYTDQAAQLTDIRREREDVAVWSFSSQQATLRRLKTARRLVKRYELIVVEDLRIVNMLRRAKPVADQDNPGAFLRNGSRS